MSTFGIGTKVAVMSHGYLVLTDVGDLSLSDPIRSRIRAAAAWGINNVVRSTKGYYNERVWAHSPPITIEQMQQFPAVNVFWMDETCNTAADLKLEGNNGLMQIESVLQFDCFVNNVNDPELAKDKILADLQKYFGRNYWIPDAGGSALAHECYYEGSEPFGTDRNVPIVGVTARFRVWYRQQRIDPASAT